MKDPYQMTLAEWEALWEFGATKAEKAEVQMNGARRLQRQRDESTIQAWRAGHKGSTCSDAIALRLAEMEHEYHHVRRATE